MLESHELRQLVAVADCGTLSAAAALLHISQPVLSRSMRRIEDKLGLSLFTRSGGNHIVLNEAGQLAVSEARGVLALLDAMELHLASYAVSLSTIRVGSSVQTPLWTLLPRIGAVAPQMTVTSELKDEQTLQSGLLRGDYDLIITQSILREPGYVSELYDSEQLHVSVPVNHPLAGRDTLALEDLWGETMLIHQDLGPWSDIPLVLQGKVNFIVIKENQMILDLARASPLLCFATNLTGSYSTWENQRVEIPVSGENMIRDYHLCAAEKDRAFLRKLLPYPQSD